MQITTHILGERLKMLRKHLGAKQEEIARELDINQNAISRIENGLGGGLDVFLKLVNYFRQYFLLDNLFDEQFEELDLKSIHKNKLSGIAVEKLKLLQEDFSEEIQQIIDMLSKED